LTEVSGIVEDLIMNQHFKLMAISAVLLAVSPGSTAAFAGDTHLRALRYWMQATGEAAAAFQRGDDARAQERLTAAIAEIRPYLPETQGIMARTYCELARVLYHQRRYAEAEPLARWALSVRDSDNQARPDAVFQCVYILALIEVALKHHAAAEPLLKRALVLQEQNLGRDQISNSVVILGELALVCAEQAKYSEAEALYLRSIAIQERETGGENLDLAATADQYASLLARMKRFDYAKHWHERARDIREKSASDAAARKAGQAARQFESSPFLMWSRKRSRGRLVLHR
jgi:tetratricopeptide (TPR) repeat protein